MSRMLPTKVELSPRLAGVEFFGIRKIGSTEKVRCDWCGVMVAPGEYVAVWAEAVAGQCYFYCPGCHRKAKGAGGEGK